MPDAGNPSRYHSRMHITIFPPEINGDTIRFRWEQDEPNPFQTRNDFFLRYQELDLAAYSAALWYEVVLAVQSRIWALHPGPVHVTFPSAIPQASVDYWLARRGATDRITVTPTADFSASPWAGLPRTRGHRPIAMLYGGGKDSTAVLAMLHELYGADSLLGIRWHIPYLDNASFARNNEERDETHIIAPIERALGIPVTRIWTDRRATIVKDHYEAARTHMELLVTAALPTLLSWGSTTICFAYASTMYPVRIGPDGTADARGGNTRPESLALERRHYEQIFGIDLTISNPQGQIGQADAIWLIAERYPHLLPNITSCASGFRTGQHCGNCEKCMELGFASLAAGAPIPGFDYDALFTHRVLWDRILSPEALASPRDEYGNLPIGGEFLGTPNRYHRYCDQMARIDPAVAAPLLGPDGMAQLRLAIDAWGHALHPSYHVMVRGWAGLQDDPVAAHVGGITAQHFPAVDRAVTPNLRRAGDGMIDFGVPYTPRTAGLPHLR